MFARRLKYIYLSITKCVFSAIHMAKRISSTLLSNEWVDDFVCSVARIGIWIGTLTAQLDKNWSFSNQCVCEAQ